MKKLISMVACIMLLGLSSVYAQTKEVTGMVIDKSGLGLPGVSVLIKGTTKGTATDINGRYTIDANSKDILVISFIGMKAQEILVGDKKEINVTLEDDRVAVEEVIVTAMGIEKSAKAVTYSVSTVDGENAAQKSEPDVLRALQGKIAGVSIEGSSAVAGSATRIVIRGASSFKGNNQPLFIVDGVPYSNDQVSGDISSGTVGQSPISTIDPNNIKSMQVLKGAAAAALYGSRAANGVVVITTKTGAGIGANGGVNVTISSSYSIEQVILPNYQNKYGVGAEFDAGNFNGSWGAPVNSVNNLDFAPDWANAFPEKYGTSMPYKAQPDNVKDMFRLGGVLDNSISINGGDRDANISITLSNLKQDSYIPDNYFNKNSISLGGNAKLSNGLKIGGTFSYTSSKRRSPLMGTSGTFQRLLFLGRSWDTNLPFEGPNGESLWFKSEDNPRWAWKHNTSENTMDRMVASFKASFNITDWMAVSYDFGVNTLFKRYEDIIEVGSTSINKKTGRFKYGTSKAQELESLLMLRIKKKLSSNLNLRANIGNNINVKDFEDVDVKGVPFIIKGIYQMSNTSDKYGATYESRRRLWALLGEVTLEYKNYLFLTMTGRNDWSSTLPKANNSFFYPSVSTSFVFSDAFNLKSDIFDSGLLRLSWAKVGNDVNPHRLGYKYKSNFANNNYVGSIRSIGFPFGGTNMHTLSNDFVDENLGPEFTSEYEIGTKLDFLKGRINLDMTYYNRKSVDQIARVNIPDESGFSSYLTNFGEMQNSGLEVALDITPIQTKDFSWNIFTTFTKNKSEVKKITDGITEMNIRNLFSNGIHSYIMIGQPYGIFKGYGAARDADSNILIDPKTGLMIKSKEETILGNPNPDYKIGLTNTFTYKGLTLSSVFDFKKGGDVYSETIPNLLHRGVTKDTEDREYTHIVAGVYGNPDTALPYFDQDGNTIRNTKQITTNELYFGKGGLGSQTYDEFKVYDGTVFRLREVSLSYNIPKNICNKVKINSANISFTGRNLFYFAPGVPEHTNFDPEVNTLGSSNNQGMEFMSAPSVRRYGMSLKLTF